MTDQELQQLRREKWRLDGKPIRTIEEARAFVEAVGFCLMYPVRPGVPVPTFIGAFVGSDNRLPTWQHAYSDPRAAAGDRTHGPACCASALPTRRICSRRTMRFWSRLLSFLIFTRWWASAIPSCAPKPGPRSPYSPLACDAFELIRRDGPISKAEAAGSAGRQRFTGRAR